MGTTDTIDRLLATLEVAVSAVVEAQVHEPIDISSASDGMLGFYLRGGGANLALAGRPKRLLVPGTMALFPPGSRFTLSPEGASPPIIAQCRIDARLYNTIGLLDRATAPLIEDMSDAAVIGSAWHAMVSESQMARPQLAMRAVIDTLMKTCILAMLRRFVARPGISLRIVSALADPRLGAAVAEILDNPGAEHSVNSLADRAGLTRSTFARQFTSQLGTSPMEFVAKTRLHHAAAMLRSSSLPIKSIAAQIGFSSRSHFSRSFRDAYGLDPQTFRRTEQIPAPAKYGSTHRAHAAGQF